MRTFDFAPLYRSTVGFDRLFDMLDNGTRPDWPPYDIEKKSDNKYRISMALAGFSPNEIELTQHGTNLLVAGEKKSAQDERHVLHQGIAFRNFRQTFNLADHVRVAGASLENGLLTIDLLREVPEQLKPRESRFHRRESLRHKTTGRSRLIRTRKPRPKPLELSVPLKARFTSR